MCVCVCVHAGVLETFLACVHVCLYVRELCSGCTCLRAQRLPSHYVCFTVGQPFTGQALWYVFRAISVQIYWFIMAEQVQCEWGDI